MTSSPQRAPGYSSAASMGNGPQPSQSGPLGLAQGYPGAAPLNAPGGGNSNAPGAFAQGAGSGGIPGGGPQQALAQALVQGAPAAGPLGLAQGAPQPMPGQAAPGAGGIPGGPLGLAQGYPGGSSPLTAPPGSPMAPSTSAGGVLQPGMPLPGGVYNSAGRMG